METINLTSIFPKLIFTATIEAIIRLWWMWFVIGIVIIVKFYFINTLNIHSSDDLFNFLVCKAIPKIDKTKLPEEIVFPKDFEWVSGIVFKFGKYGTLDFQGGENIGKQIFNYFTEAKGKYVLVRTISKELNTSDKDVRARIKTLNDRLLNIKGNKKGFVKIKPSGKGSYRLSISPLLNTPKS